MLNRHNVGVDSQSHTFNSINDHLKLRICYEYVVNYCYNCCNTLGCWILCSAWGRFTNTHFARDCSNFTACLAIHWQKTVEINYPLSFYHKNIWRIKKCLVKGMYPRTPLTYLLLHSTKKKA